MNVDALLRRIDHEKTVWAASALSRPQSRDEFEYGRVVGFYAGLDRVKGIIDDMLSEQEKKGANL